jgi:8-oxo-dGTP pyrophosphatase MutT (NUDIX family)
MVFGESNAASFTSGWEILMGQSEVLNWLRSTKSAPRAQMRYGGEFKFAGGSQDGNESIVETAVRELEEEFLLNVPHGAKLRFLSVRQTRPVKNTSHIMVNFLALQEENQWLQELDVGGINSKLEDRRKQHRQLVESGAFWEMVPEAKETVSPEIRQVEWLDLRQAVLNSFTSMNAELVCVNDFQQRSFEEHGIATRDPMYLTMLSLLELESFPSGASVQRELTLVSPSSGSNLIAEQVEAQVAKVQWLTEGLTPQEVKAIFDDRQARRSQGERIGADVMGANDLAASKARRIREDQDGKARSRL